MGDETSPGQGSVILYEGSPLEKIAASSIVLNNSELMKSERIFLASDVIIGEYGVTGFVLVDNKPENRWRSYTDGEWTGVTFKPNDIELPLFYSIGENSPRLVHFVDTDKGFKMIRYFVLPSHVKEFFERDRHLGSPLIEKCCEEGTLPAEFDEVKVDLGYAFNGEQTDLINRILERVNPRFEKIPEVMLWQNIGQHAYFSFHPWQHYKPVLQAGEEAVVRAIRNFDMILSRFDMRNTLAKRELKPEIAQPYAGVLPPVE